MRRILALFLFVAYCCPLLCMGSTIVVSNIVANTTWTAAGSPYYICYWNFSVLSNVTLTIQPGVTVIFGKGEHIGGGYYLGDQLTVYGNLIASGATFTSTNTAPASWSALQFMNGSFGLLTDCTIEYGGSGAMTYGLVHVSGTSDIWFDGCTFRFGEYEGDSGVHIFSDATGAVRFVDCLFTNLNIGVTTERDSGVDVEITGCTFDNLHAYGTLLRNNFAAIHNCVFRNILDIDVVLWESWINNWWCKTAELVGNQFYGGGKAVFPVLMYGAVNFSASGNTLSGYSATNSGVRVGGWVPKGWSATWSASDMDYIVPETVTVDGDASSLGTLTVLGGATVRFYPNAVLRVWGNLELAGTPASRVRLTSALSYPTGNGLWLDHAWGTVNVAYSEFTALNRGLFVGWIDTPTVRVSVAHTVFSNIADRVFDMLDVIGHAELHVRDSLVTENGTSLYMDRGGLASFSNVVFRQTGVLRAINWGNTADFEHCNFIGLRMSDGGQPIRGTGGNMTFRHCTMVGSEGEGISLTGGRLTDCILWGHRWQAVGGTSITANYCCIEGGYIGPGSNNLTVAPGFIGWSGAATVYVDSAASCPGSGTPAAPYCSLAYAIGQYRDSFDYGLATNSPLIGAASDGGNIGADNGVGAPRTTALEVRLAAGTYGLGGRDLLMNVSLVGTSPESVLITNTVKGLQSGARLEGVTIASTENQGLEIYGPHSPTIGNCVFSNLTNNAIYIYNAYPTAVDPCAPTITAVRIRDLYSPSASLRGIYIDGRLTPGKTTPEIRNSLFHNINSGVSGRQGALHAFYASPLVLNSTFFTNKVGLCSEGPGTATVWNCISYQNRDTDLWNYESRMRIGHSDYGKYSTYGSVTLWTTNNLNADPLFVDRAAYDLRLAWTSPCINRGTNQPWMADATDFYGSPRILHRFVDMGAYEHLYEWPMVSVAPTSITVRAATTELVPDTYFDVWNSGSATLNYTLTTNVPWLIVSPTSGDSTGEVDTITVSFAAGLSAGSYSGLVTVADAAASNSPQNVSVILHLQAPAIRCSSTNITVNVPVGGTTTARTFDVWNGTTGTMNYVLSTNVAWLSISPTEGSSTGEHDMITLNFDTASLAPGTYSGAVIITSAEATNSPQLVNVTLNVLGPYIVRSPTTLTAVTEPGSSPAAQSFNVRNGGPHAINYTITTNVDWLTVSPGEGASTGEWDMITLTYNTAALGVGAHTGIVTIAAPEATNSPQIVTVVVRVLLPSIVCSPTGFTAAVAPGVAWSDQILRVWNGTLGTMNYALATNAAWLSVSPTAGVSTGEQDSFTVSLRTEALPEGGHTGLIVIVSAEATNSPLNVPVIVNVLDFNRALNTTGLPWRSGGDAPWFLQTNTTHDGVEAAQSGDITDSQTSWVEVTVSGPATLSFWWRVSSENNYDYLRFYVDTTQVAAISGTAGTWLARTNTIPDGTHVVRWAYTKDGIVSSGSDCGWLDEVRYVYDSDGDGLPDLWEQRYWGDPVSTNEAAGDYDGDGHNNREEFVADTDPTDTNSFLRITAVSNASHFAVYFPSSTNRWYILSACEDLRNMVWSHVPGGGPARGAGSTGHFTDTNEPPRGSLYRVEAQLP